MVARNLCACYRVYVRDRNTRGVHCEYEIASLSFNAVLNQTSGLEIDVPLIDGCCPCLPMGWRDEIVVERLSENGESEGTVWEGTVLRTVEDRLNNTLKIYAFDNSIWWARKGNTNTIIEGVQDEAVLWSKLVNGFEQICPSGLLIPAPRLTGTLVNPQTLGQTETSTETTETTRDSNGEITETKTTVSRVLQANVGVIDVLFGGLLSVNWTVFGGKLYGPGPNTVGPNSCGSLKGDVDWEEQGAVIDIDASNVVSQVTLVGYDLDGNELVGIYPPVNRPDPVTKTHIRYEIVDTVWGTQQQADLAAKKVYDSNRVANRFVVTSAGSLSTDSAYTIWDLIPGKIFDVSFQDECNEFQFKAEVYNVAVNASSAGDCIREDSVAVDFRPVGVDGVSQDRASF